MHRKYWLGVVGIALLGGCVDPEIPWNKDPDTQRWYSQQQVDEGGKLFAGYCASCHGPRAEGTEQWKKPDAQGMYPPPPLNGTAHAWHHPYPQLLRTIREGTQGNMPGWQAQLSDAQISAVIAHFQSYWPDRGYQLWLARHKH